MHLYYWDPGELEKKLNDEFIGGQFQMKTIDWVFRGKVKECMALASRRIKVSFSWLCERHFFFDNSWTPRPKWSLLPAPPSLHYLDVEYRYFYVQDDEDRVKVKGRLGEICHFFKPGDHTNLVQRGDEFVPYCQLYQQQLRRVVIALLSPKRQ